MATRIKSTKPEIKKTMSSLEVEELAQSLGLRMKVVATQFVLASAYTLAQGQETAFVNAIRKVTDDLAAGNPLYFNYEKTTKEFEFLSSQAGTNGDRSDYKYVATTGTCTCPAGENKRYCRHQAAATLIRSIMAFIQEGREINEARALWRVAVMDETLKSTN